ncbi:uncharacterized protein LOC135819298 [Sycon ciliatum]|uniref:uncharacterized protein LOC135819298 n=1 Tax=Sycon ciliatum TaxID=27933 RepID=UPI0031F6E7C6|eukprot:scpid44130/ scgid24466/ 
MAFCRALLRSRSTSTVWQYASHHRRYLSSSSHPLVASNDENLSRLKECVKTTLPWALDNVGEKPVTARKEMAELLQESFGDKVKSIATAVLRTCPFAAAVLPIEYVSERNKLWVVYTMKDEEFLARHLWQQKEPQKSEPYVLDDWLHLIEVQDFCRMLFGGDVSYAETFVSPYANRVLISKDWGIVRNDSYEKSAEFATPVYVARALETISKLRGEIDFEKPFVQAVAPPLEDVERWCTIFRLLHNVDNGLSGRPLVGFHDFRAGLSDGAEVPPFVENKAEILSLLAYKEGIMNDSDLDKHLRKMILMHQLPYLCKTDFKPSVDVLGQFYTYLLLARVEGWIIKEDDATSSSDDVKHSARQQLESYFDLRLEAANAQGQDNVQSFKDGLDRQTAALREKHAQQLEVAKKRIELMEVVWGDEKELALDEVIRKQEREEIEVLHPLKLDIALAEEENMLEPRLLETRRQELRELVEHMQVLAVTKPGDNTSFILYRYPLSRQIVSASHFVAEDDSDVYNGIQVLSDKPAAQRVLACNISWFLRHLAHEPVLVEALLSRSVQSSPEFKKLTTSIEKSVIAALCKNVGIAAMKEMDSEAASVEKLRSCLVKVQQAQDVLSKKPLQRSADASSLSADATQLKAECKDALGKLEALCRSKLGDASSDLSAISRWLKEVLRLVPVRRDESRKDSKMSDVDKWLIADIPADTRAALECTATKDVQLITSKLEICSVSSVASSLLDGVKTEEAIELRDKVTLPSPPLPLEEPTFSYPEWRLIRRRRRQEDSLRRRLRRRGKWRAGTKMLRCGWYLGMKRPPVDFSDCYTTQPGEEASATTK